MTFLPIIDRELRTAARRRGTYRLRWWTALCAMAMSLASGVLLMATHGRGGMGNPLFNLLTGYAFLLCCLAGVFLTADCLSEEKREGTLGLLFLTDLRGYDVVLGKFFGRALNPFYGLLALLPVLALSLLLGGVTGAEFWRRSLALLNALFFSLSLGMGLSAVVREARRAVSEAFALLLLITVGLPLLAGAFNLAHLPPQWQAVALLSPLRSFEYAADILYRNHAATYWGGLAVVHLAGWVSLVAASLVVPHSWQDRPANSRQSALPSTEAAPTSNRARSRARARGALLEENPVRWISGRDLRAPAVVWLLVLVWAFIVISTLYFLREMGAATGMLLYCSHVLGYFIKLLFAWQVCQYFAEARRSGTLEMLLSTPLSNREILSGHAQAALRGFAWPLGIFIVLTFLPGAVLASGWLFQWKISSVPDLMVSSLFPVGYAVRMLLDLLAIYWLGLWLALSSRRPQNAPLLTILFVLILPLPASMCWLDVVVDIVLIAIGAGNMRRDLRSIVLGQSKTES